MKTAVSHLSTSLLDYETGEYDRKICIKTSNGDLKYTYLLKWLGQVNDDGEQIISEVPNQLIDDVWQGFDNLVHAEPVISELAIKTVMWDEVHNESGLYDAEYFRDLQQNWLFGKKPDNLEERIVLVKSFLRAYIILKRRINKAKNLKIVQKYMANSG